MVKWISFVFYIVVFSCSHLSLAVLSKDGMITLIKTFYMKRSVSLVTAFVCWEDSDLALFRTLNTMGIRLSIVSDRNATTAIKKSHDDAFHRVGFVVDASCNGAQLFLETSSQQKRFTILNHWLIIDNRISLQNTSISYNGVLTYSNNLDYHDEYQLSPLGTVILNNVDMLTNSRVTWCQPYDNATSVLLLLEIYRPCNRHPMIIALVGEVRVTDGVRMKLLDREAATAGRGDLKGVVIKAATVILRPDQFHGMDDLTTKNVDTWSKIHYPVAMYLADQLNFSIEVQTLDSYGWHGSGDNVSFDGLIGLLQRHDVEITATGIFMRHDRMEQVSFTANTFKIRTAIIFKQPCLSSVTNIFILPFSDTVWLGCVTLCAVTLALLSLQIFFTKSHVGEGDSRTEEPITWLDVVTHVFGIVCQQGIHSIPRSLAVRTTVFVMSLASLFFFTSYSANIVALLQTPSMTIKNIADLTESPLVLGIEDVEYNRQYIKETADVATRELIRRKLKNGGEAIYWQPSDGLSKVRNGMYAFQVDTSIGYKIISETYTEREKCGLMELELYPLPMFAMGTVKGSSYQELLGQRLRWQREAGILDRLWKIWVIQKPICENKLGGFVSVGLIDFYSALLVLYYGTLAAVAIFLGEILHFNRLKLLTLFVKPRRRRENEMKRAFNKVSTVESRAGRARQPWGWTD